MRHNPLERAHLHSPHSGSSILFSDLGGVADLDTWGSAASSRVAPDYAEPQLSFMDGRSWKFRRRDRAMHTGHVLLYHIQDKHVFRDPVTGPFPSASPVGISITNHFFAMAGTATASRLGCQLRLRRW